MPIETKFTNPAIAKLLKDVASAYEVLGEDFFKTRAYRLAADAIEKAPGEIKDFWEEDRLSSIPGVGSAIKGYLDEYFTIGRVKHFDKIKKKLPSGMFSLLEIPGIGPKTAYRLSKELGIKSKEQLIKSAKRGEIAKLTGFGIKSQGEILKSTEKKREKKSRILLDQAERLAIDYIKYLQTVLRIMSVDPLGSLRRRVSTVGDIDIAIATDKPTEALKAFVNYKKVEKVLDKGTKKASVLLNEGQRVDLMVSPLKMYGSLLQHFTGSKSHNIQLREYARERGFSLSEYGIKKKDGKREIFSTEGGFYRYLDLQFIPPEIREGADEIKKSKENKLPKLINLEDIKGDLHSHTNYSDGKESIYEMAEAARKKGYKYFGITDHSPSIKTRGEKNVLALIERQRKEIEHLKYSNSDIKILLGTECNILSSGSLSLPNNILEKYDFAIGAIHTSFDQTKDQITKRLFNAISNPFINFIAHPTGRLINQRDAYPVDWEKVFEYAKGYKKPLEINSHPQRLDLPDILVKEAVRKGVSMIINTDAHSTDQLENIKYGIDVAKRGWCSKENVVNTLPLKDLINFLKIRNQ